MRHALAVLAIAGLAAAGLVHAQDGPYRFSKEIAIGGEGGWDYLSVDPAAHRLYVSHAAKVVVIDTQANKVVGEITDTPGVHGFAIAADLGRGFSSNGRENKASIVDLKTLKLIQKVDTGENPDAILYEPGRHDSARGQAGVRAGRFQGGPGVRQHRGHERDPGHRQGDAQGRRHLVDRAG